MPLTVDVNRTRQDIRRTFQLWDIDGSEFEILWEENKLNQRARLPGAIVRYLRNGKWQMVSCYGFPSRAQNLRQCYLLLDRLRIAEQNGVQYEGLSFTKEVATTNTESLRREELLDAYDILGVSPDDPIELIKGVYNRKVQYYHPDKQGGDAEKFKRVTAAYNLIMKTRGNSN